MNTKDLATALEEWASAEVPGLNSEPNQPEQLSQSLPLVICEITEKRRRKAGDDGALSAYQQTDIRGWSATLLLLVDPTDKWVASQALYDMVDTLELAIVRDQTLGGRVTVADTDHTASFVPPEVEHQDGTVARAATMRLTIGERVTGGS